MVADESMIGRAVENFLTNALRHTPESGEIRVSAEAEANGTRICVYNSGSHLTPEQLARIWDVFYTGENGERANGHGVGLAIVKSIAQLHGGNVSAKNGSEGVVFCLSIPHDQTRHLLNKSAQI
jgi:signal transduction histidine kinase